MVSDAAAGKMAVLSARKLPRCPFIGSAGLYGQAFIRFSYGYSAESVIDFRIYASETS
jgi:hypothetical protein